MRARATVGSRPWARTMRRLRVRTRRFDEKLAGTANRIDRSESAERRLMDGNNRLDATVVLAEPMQKHSRRVGVGAPERPSRLESGSPDILAQYYQECASLAPGAASRETPPTTAPVGSRRRYSRNRAQRRVSSVTLPGVPPRYPARRRRPEPGPGRPIARRARIAKRETADERARAIRRVAAPTRAVGGGQRAVRRRTPSPRVRARDTASRGVRRRRAARRR